MFMLYGIRDPVFTGSLEEMDRVHALSRAAAARKIIAKGDDLGVAPTTLTHKPHDKPYEEAIRAYQALVHHDVERGPLYHAYQIMSREVITLQDDDAVASAWQIFLQHHIHEAPVLNAEKRLVGFVSERDLLTTINIENGKVIDAMHHLVRDVMTTPVVAAEPVTDIRRIATVMLKHSVDGVPIVNANHELVGFVSRSDILQAVVADPPLSLWR